MLQVPTLQTQVNKSDSSIRFKAPHNVRVYREASTWLLDVANLNHILPEHFDRLELLLNEALANVINYGGDVSPNSEIELHFHFVTNSVMHEATITVVDDGIEFNPLEKTTEALPQTLEEAVPGKLGIHLIKNIADRLSYQYYNNRNHFSFSVRWNFATNEFESSAAKFQSFGRKSERRIINHSVHQESRSTSRNRRQLGLDWLRLFKGLDESVVAKIIHDSEVIILQASYALLKPDEYNTDVFILLSGHLKVHIASGLGIEKPLIIFPGECVGEFSAIDSKPISALVSAIDNVRLLKLTQDKFWNELMSIPGMARNLLAVLTERMRRTNVSMLENLRIQMSLQHLRRELDVAKQLQASMLPLRRPMLPDQDLIEIAAIMQPASEIGGDFFDAYFLDREHLFFCIADVAGHGIPAAMYMAESIGLLRLLTAGFTNPGELLRRMNNQLCLNNDTNMFVTLFCGFLNVNTGHLVYSNGGHYAPILYRNGGISRLPLPKGSMLGAIPDLDYTCHEVTLLPDDILVCFTDGAIEAINHAGMEYSEDRLLTAIHSAAGQSMEGMLDSIRDDISSFIQDKLSDDDYTLLCLRRHPVRPFTDYLI